MCVQPEFRRAAMLSALSERPAQEQALAISSPAQSAAMRPRPAAPQEWALGPVSCQRPARSVAAPWCRLVAFAEPVPVEHSLPRRKPAERPRPWAPQGQMWRSS